MFKKKKKKKKPSETFLNLKTILEIALHFQKYIEKTINKYILIKHGKDDYFSVLVIEKI